MSVNELEPMKPADRRARLIRTWEGKWLNLGDIKRAVNDPAFIVHCAEMLAVGQERGEQPLSCLKMVIGCVVATLSGELAEKHPTAQKETKK